MVQLYKVTPTVEPSLLILYTICMKLNCLIIAEIGASAYIVLELSDVMASIVFRWLRSSNLDLFRTNVYSFKGLF